MYRVSGVIDWTTHFQYWYSQDLDRFQRVRFDYYLYPLPISYREAQSLLVRDMFFGLMAPSCNLEQSFYKLRRLRPDVVIVTATYNRLSQLQRLCRLRQST